MTAALPGFGSTPGRTRGGSTPSTGRARSDGPGATLVKIAGFESTDYALLRGTLVWIGDDPTLRHPRNLRSPWSPPPIACDPQRLRAGARACLDLLHAMPATGLLHAMPATGLLHALPGTGLLHWLTGQPLPFPLNRATPRFDAIRAALERNDLRAFEAGARRILGLGQGLTPSGDDFVGGICFALRYAPRDAWRADLPAVLVRIRSCAATATNVISAALLDDLIDGASYGALHELLAALQGKMLAEIAHATQALLRVGASSGADMLAGLLAALLTTPCSDIEAQP